MPRGSTPEHGAPEPDHLEVGPAPLITAAPRPAKRRRLPVEVSSGDPASPLLFLEIFAGEAGLTEAVRNAGVRTLPPNEFAFGGTDFTSDRAVESLKSQLVELRQAGNCLAIHLAPTCSSFSHARDRARRTRVRSSRFPGGLPHLLRRGSAARKAILYANKVAYEAFALAAWARGTLQAVVSNENLDRSYLWPFADNSDLELAMLLWHGLPQGYPPASLGRRAVWPRPQVHPGGHTFYLRPQGVRRLRGLGLRRRLHGSGGGLPAGPLRRLGCLDRRFGGRSHC